MTLVCASCQSEMRPDARFCPKCGAASPTEVEFRRTHPPLTVAEQVTALNRLIEGWVFYAFAAVFGLGSILGVSVAFTATPFQLDLLWSIAGFITCFLILLVSWTLEWIGFRTLACGDFRMVRPTGLLFWGIPGLVILTASSAVFLKVAWFVSSWPALYALFVIPVAAGALLLTVGTYGWARGKRHLAIEYGIPDLLNFFNWDPFLTLHGLYRVRNDLVQGTTAKFRATGKGSEGGRPSSP